MAKKRMFVTLAMIVILVGVVGVSAEAQQNVASVSKKGSLLIFPFIYTGNGEYFDTIVQIGNDAAQSTTVKCYWMDFDQNAWDFEFSVTPNQPVWFSAATGQGSIDVGQFGRGIEGELKCWAIDTATDPESVRQFNHLYGSAMVWTGDSGEPIAFEYNAWAFALRSIPGDPSGPLTLNGATDYDACPAYLSYNFFAYGADVQGTIFGGSFLALSPCQQDLRQDRSPICTKAKFDLWNENETKFTGAYTCIKCTSWELLQYVDYYEWNGCDIPQCKPTGVGGEKFFKSVLHTDMGRFRVTPSTFSACKGVFAQYDQAGKTVVDACPPANQYQTPFVGVMLTQMFVSELDLRIVTTTGVGAGAWTAPKPIPQILWDAGAGSALSPKRN
jgi:hypothetical protein